MEKTIANAWINMAIMHAVGMTLNQIEQCKESGKIEDQQTLAYALQANVQDLETYTPTGIC